MDNLDVRIFRELFQGEHLFPYPRDVKSYRLIVERLKVAEGTVRARIERLYRTGFIKGWRLLVNPHLLGFTAIALGFDVPRSTLKHDLVEKLRSIPGMLVINSYHGSFLALHFYCEDDQSLNMTLELISKLSKGENRVISKLPYPACFIKLSIRDWRIIQALRIDPNKSYNAISEEIGMSSRTVRRRLSRMIREKALFAILSREPKALEGAVMADLTVTYSDRASKNGVNQEILKRLGDHIYYAGITAEFGLFGLILPNVPIAREAENKVRKLEGVEHARVDLLEERIELYNALDHQVARRMAQIEVEARRP